MSARCEFSDILKLIEGKVVESSLASSAFIQSVSCMRHISNGFVHTNLFISTSEIYQRQRVFSARPHAQSMPEDVKNSGKRSCAEFTYIVEIRHKKPLANLNRRATLWYCWNPCCISAHWENISMASLDPFSKGSRVGLEPSRSALTWFHHLAVASTERENSAKRLRWSTRAVPIFFIGISRVSAGYFRGCISYG